MTQFVVFGLIRGSMILYKHVISVSYLIVLYQYGPD